MPVSFCPVETSSHNISVLPFDTCDIPYVGSAFTSEINEPPRCFTPFGSTVSGLTPLYSYPTYWADADAADNRTRKNIANAVFMGSTLAQPITRKATKR